MAPGGQGAVQIVQTPSGDKQTPSGAADALGGHFADALRGTGGLGLK